MQSLVFALPQFIWSNLAELDAGRWVELGHIEDGLKGVQTSVLLHDEVGVERVHELYLQTCNIFCELFTQLLGNDPECSEVVMLSVGEQSRNYCHIAIIQVVGLICHIIQRQNCRAA